METLPALLVKSDIVLTSMNSRRLTLSIDTTREALKQRRRKPMFLIDIGVPGDIDQTIEFLEDAYLYSLDDLERVTRTGLFWSPVLNHQGSRDRRLPETQ